MYYLHDYLSRVDLALVHGRLGVEASCRRESLDGHWEGSGHTLHLELSLSLPALSSPDADSFQTPYGAPARCPGPPQRPSVRASHRVTRLPPVLLLSFPILTLFPQQSPRGALPRRDHHPSAGFGRVPFSPPLSSLAPVYSSRHSRFPSELRIGLRADGTTKQS